MLVIRKRAIFIGVAILVATIVALVGLLHYGEFEIGVASRSYTRDVYIDDEFHYSKLEYNVEQKGNPLVNSLLSGRETRGEKRGYTNRKRDSTHRKRDSPLLVLILSTIAGSSAYGPKRNFGDFYDTISSIISPEYSISLAFLVTSEREFKKIDKTIKKRLLASQSVSKVTILRAPLLEEDIQIDKENRHADQLQRQRRRIIAKSRNFLLSHSLDLNQYSLFVDSDIENIENSNQFLSTLISSKLDIVVPRIIKGSDQDYDKNSWRGERTKPTKDQLDLMNKNLWDQASYVPRDILENMFHFTDYLENEVEYNLHKDELQYLVELDSVGGGVLFAKSIIYKQGAMFPTSYIVGTSWDRLEGYDGIETEGLCYLAKPLGYRCWGMPNLVAYHSDR
jgi:hypothetical protein